MGLFNLKKNTRVFEPATQDSKRQNIIAALKNGEHLSIYDGRRFECGEMHTEFCKINKKIRDGKITGFAMCSTWRTNENGVRYKEYWFERENG